MSAIESSIRIYKDVPIKEIREDRFGRSSLVDLLAKSIQEKCRFEHDSICIGVYGKWGEGKTSFVNMLKNHPVIDSESSAITVADFNPWIINNEQGAY